MDKENFFEIIRARNGPPYLIAEAGVNHNGDIKKALELIDVAADVGADAVKFQTFKAEKLVTSYAALAGYQKNNLGKNILQREMLSHLELKENDYSELIEHCKKRRILFLSTPFEEASADFLEQLAVPAFKIPSGEITNLPLVSHIAKKGKPIILSTGMASLSEVETAVLEIERANNHQIILLHCVSQYPAPDEDTNLRAMETLKTAFQYPVGLSDHSIGTAIPIAAFAMGACIIEKHFTLSKKLEGPDHQASLEPQELSDLVISLKRVYSALGNSRKRPAESERDTALVARKSIVAIGFIPAGTVLSEDMLIMKRPGTGLPAAFLNSIIGRRTKSEISADEQICLSNLE